MERNGTAMRRMRSAALSTMAAASLLAVTAQPASAIGIANGDLVVTFVKNGFELIVNLGAAPNDPGGTTIDATALVLPAAFGGSLEGARWTAFGVRNPDATFSDPDLFGAPQSNLILTTLGDPSVVSFSQVSDAQAQLQPANQGQAWFALLRQVGAANGSTILENTATRLVIGTGLFASYTNNLGFSTDAVGNTLPLSSTGSIGAQVLGTALPLFELLQDIALPDFDLGTAVASLGVIRLVPEPGTALLLLAGVVGLARYGRRAARAGA